jgi:hypothetical protein
MGIVSAAKATREPMKLKRRSPMSACASVMTTCAIVTQKVSPIVVPALAS